MLLIEGRYSYRFLEKIHSLLISQIIYYKKITGFVPEKEDNEKCVICHYLYLNDKLKFSLLFVITATTY